MDKKEMYSFKAGNNPLVATAIHDGHEIREEIIQLYAIDGKSGERVAKFVLKEIGNEF